MKRTFLYILAALLAASCKNSSVQNNKSEGDKPVITVTIEPLRYFTEAIAGDNFNVISMVPKGSSPEKTWMDKLTDNAPHLQFFDTSRGIDLIYDSSHAHHHHDADEPHAHDSIQDDEHQHLLGVEPHVWSSAYNAQIIAGNIVNALCAIDKGNEEVYMERYKSLCNQIEHTDSLICHMLSAPNADRAFMIYHPALSYFARDYGLHQISIEENGKEPSPSHLKNLIDTCKKEKVRVIFVQPEFDRRNAEIIAKQTGTKVIPINPLSYDWEEEMLNIAKELVVKN